MLYYTSGVKRYFLYAIVSIKELGNNKTIVDIRREIDLENRGIIEAIYTFIVIVPKYLKTDENIYTFSNRILY